jgi:hypothetical protein
MVKPNRTNKTIHGKQKSNRNPGMIFGGEKTYAIEQKIILLSSNMNYFVI